MQIFGVNIREYFGLKRAIVVIGIFSLSLVASCRSKQADPSTSANQNSESEPTAGSQTGLLTGWESPRAVLVFSGDEHGYLEPCGCSEKQSGGFSRRHDLMRQLREDRGWAVSAFDVGGILHASRVTYPQSKIKFKHMLSGFSQMGYQGLELGLEELLLGPDVLYEQHTTLSAEEGFDVPFLGSNVTLYGTKELGTPINSRIIEIGDVKVGVIGVVGQTTREKIEQTGLIADESVLKIDLPQAAIEAELAEVQKQNPQMLVLLSHAEIDESEELAKRFPQFQVVVTSGSAEDPRKEPGFVGETMIVQVGKKGKNVVAVGLFADDELKHELIELDMHRFDFSPAMTELMRSYQGDLKDHYGSLVGDDLAISHPSGDTFAGAESCKDCHTFAYGIWSKSKHAHAYESLIKGRPSYGDAWVERIWDPECLSCHVTGWEPQEALRFHSGFFSKEVSAHLAGNQCENCHGPAAQHVQLEKVWKQDGVLTPEVVTARKNLQLNVTSAEQKVCVRCHDLDNSPKFNFATYWKEVNHSGRKD